MKLLAVRDINAQDPLPTLGPKVAPPTPPDPPALRPTATPGIMQRPDGKLETDLPLPPPDPLALAPNRFAGSAVALHNLPKSATVQRLMRAWQADLTEIENRAMGHFGDCGYYHTADEKKSSPKCLTYEQCQANFEHNRKLGYMSPLMVPGVIYPKEAIEDSLVLIPGRDSYLMYEDGPTRSVVIPLPGQSGADYFP